MLQKLKDLVTAHWKAIVAAVALVLVQEVDDQTADWIILALGTLGVVVKSNDPDAVARIYRKR
jgi:hypothetical protein